MKAKKDGYEVNSSTMGGWIGSFLRTQRLLRQVEGEVPQKGARSDVNDRLLAKAAARDGGAPGKRPCYPLCPPTARERVWRQADACVIRRIPQRRRSHAACAIS